MITSPSTAQRLIASPSVLLDDTDHRLIPTLLGLTAVGGAIIGAAAGLQHDGLQGLYSSVKMPAMLVIPPLLVLPALRGLSDTLDLDLPLRKAAVAAIATSARTAIFAAALTPIYWLFGAATGESYAALVFGLAATMAVGGMFGWAVLAAAPGSSTPKHLRSLAFTLGSGVLFLLAAGQTGWHLRPFVRQQSAPASFFAPPEGDIYSSLKERLDGRGPSRARLVEPTTLQAPVPADALPAVPADEFPADAIPADAIPADEDVPAGQSPLPANAAPVDPVPPIDDATPADATPADPVPANTDVPADPSRDP